MRVSTKLGIAGLITWGALQIVAAAIAPPLEASSDSLALVYTMAKREAIVSVQLLSVAALVIGISGLIYSAYRRMWSKAYVNAPSNTPALSAAVRHRSIGRKAEFVLVLAVLVVLFAVN